MAKIRAMRGKTYNKIKKHKKKHSKKKKLNNYLLN